MNQDHFHLDEIPLIPLAEPRPMRLRDLRFRDDLPSKIGLKTFGPTYQIRFSESLQLLVLYLGSLSMSPSRLSKLLGTGSSSTVFHWVSGRSRPSPAYLSRMIHLILWDKEHPGQLPRIRTFDWISWEPEYWPGWEPTREEPIR